MSKPIAWAFCGLLLGGLCAGLAGLSGAEEEETLNLRFGVYTSEKPEALQRKFKPALVHLERQLAKKLERPVRIRLRIFKSYVVARQALLRGYVDFTRVGPATYVVAKSEDEDISLLAVEKNKHGHFFKGVIAVRKDSGITEIEKLKGKTFAFGSPNSTIGRYLSQAHLAASGVYADDLEDYEYLMRHDRVAEAVLAGDFDAGALKESTFKKYQSRGLVALSTFRNVTKPWISSPTLGAEIKKAISASLLALDEAKVLRALGKNVTGFVEARDELYDFVREGMDNASRFGDY